MQQESQKEEVLEYIAKEPGLIFRQLRFRLEMNESTLNKALINLTKHNLIKKDNEFRYFVK